MNKSKLNGSEKLFAEAVRIVVKKEIDDATRDLATKDDIDLVLDEMADFRGEMAGTKKEIAGVKKEIAGAKKEIADTKQEIADTKQEINARVDTLNENTQVQFREVNKRLGKLEKGVEETVRIYRTH